jgi:glutathione S-transferase
VEARHGVAAYLRHLEATLADNESRCGGITMPVTWAPLGLRHVAGGALSVADFAVYSTISMLQRTLPLGALAPAHPALSDFMHRMAAM